MIKIAFFDVDGTLLKLGSKEPSPKTVQALQQLQANGVLLCMATGRGYLSIPHFEGVDFDIWLTFNGPMSAVRIPCSSKIRWTLTTNTEFCKI